MESYVWIIPFDGILSLFGSIGSLVNNISRHDFCNTSCMSWDTSKSGHDHYQDDEQQTCPDVPSVLKCCEEFGVDIRLPVRMGGARHAHSFHKSKCQHSPEQ